MPLIAIDIAMKCLDYSHFALMDAIDLVVMSCSLVHYWCPSTTATRWQWTSSIIWRSLKGGVWWTVEATAHRNTMIMSYLLHQWLPHDPHSYFRLDLNSKQNNKIWSYSHGQKKTSPPKFRVFCKYHFNDHEFSNFFAVGIV